MYERSLRVGAAEQTFTGTAKLTMGKWSYIGVTRAECKLTDNKHVNDILQYKSTLNIPGWEIDCSHLGTQSIGNPLCPNWSCFKDRHLLGYIKTTLSGSGRAKLDFGNCYHTSGIVKVFLDNTEIASATNGTASKTVEFDYNDGNELKLVEENTAIIMFNSFEVLSSNGTTTTTLQTTGTS